MEFFTIFLSSLLGLVSPAGLVVDRIIQNAIRSQFEVEQLQVRVDNAPSYQLLQGKVERVRIAGRGLQPKGQDIRIAALELETDPIALDLRSLGSRQPKVEPLQTGLRLVLTQKDINQALQSPKLTARLSKLGLGKQGYNFVNPRVEFLENNRLRFQVELQEQGDVKPLAITVESGLGVLAGRQIQLVKPFVSVNGAAVPEQFVSAIATDLNQQLDLRNLEGYGLQARILQLKITPQELEIAAFLRVEPSSQLLKRRSSISLLLTQVRSRSYGGF